MIYDEPDETTLAGDLENAVRELRRMVANLPRMSSDEILRSVIYCAKTIEDAQDKLEQS